MVEETAWLPFAVGQVAALAVGALSVMIMPTERPSAAMAPVSARLRARGRAEEVMSRFLLPCRGWSGWGWGWSDLSGARAAGHRGDDGGGGLGGVAVRSCGEGADLRDLGGGSAEVVAAQIGVTVHVTVPVRGDSDSGAPEDVVLHEHLGAHAR